MGLISFAHGSPILEDNVSVLLQDKTSLVSKDFNPYQTKFSQEFDSINTLNVSANMSSSGVGSNENLWALPNLFLSLQIELLYFRVTCLDKDNQYFEWEVADEINNYFEVEESVDGKNWVSLKKIYGEGNCSKNTKKYSFTYYKQRAETPSSIGYFYRLKQVDFRNVQSFSDVVLSNCNNYEPDEINVVPNPTSGTFMVSCYDLDVREIRIIDMLGNILGRRQINGDGYVCEEYFSIENSAKGIYFISIITKDNTVVKKIVHQ